MAQTEYLVPRSVGSTVPFFSQHKVHRLPSQCLVEHAFLTSYHIQHSCKCQQRCGLTLPFCQCPPLLFYPVVDYGGHFQGVCTGLNALRWARRWTSCCFIDKSCIWSPSASAFSAKSALLRSCVSEKASSSFWLPRALSFTWPCNVMINCKNFRIVQPVSY